MFKKIIIIISIFSILILIPSLVFADKIKYKMQVPIGDKEEITISDTSIGEYVKSVYGYAIGIVGILATVVLMAGGIIWITAGGNSERIGNAKSWITASLTGLVLVLCSYMILYYVNPSLVNFEPIVIKPVEVKSKLGCCPKPKCQLLTTKKECTGGGWMEGMDYICDRSDNCKKRSTEQGCYVNKGQRRCKTIFKDAYDDMISRVPTCCTAFKPKGICQGKKCCDEKGLNCDEVK